jgi:hypothetical protein
MEVTCYFETSVYFQRTTLRYSLEDNAPQRVTWCQFRSWVVKACCSCGRWRKRWAGICSLHWILIQQVHPKRHQYRPQTHRVAVSTPTSPSVCKFVHILKLTLPRLFAYSSCSFSSMSFGLNGHHYWVRLYIKTHTSKTVCMFFLFIQQHVFRPKWPSLLSAIVRGLSVKEGSQWFFTMKNMFTGIE